MRKMDIDYPNKILLNILVLLLNFIFPFVVKRQLLVL